MHEEPNEHHTKVDTRNQFMSNPNKLQTYHQKNRTHDIRIRKTHLMRLPTTILFSNTHFVCNGVCERVINEGDEDEVIPEESRG